MGSIKVGDGEDTPTTMGCVSALSGDLERPVYLIKNGSEGNKGLLPFLPPNACPSSIMQQWGGTMG